MRDTVLEYFQDLSKSLDGEKNINRALIAIYLFDFLDRLNKENFPPNWLISMKKEITEINSLNDFLGTTFDIPANLDKWEDDEFI